jgi:hypothetical protein
MGIDYSSFLIALATWMAGRAGVEFSDTPRALWVNVAVEEAATDPYSVLRVYGGDLNQVPVPRVSIQCRTVGSSGDAAWARAVALFNTLLDADSAPIRMTAISSAWRINGVFVTSSPAAIGVDENKRTQWIFNVDVEFVGV